VRPGAGSLDLFEDGIGMMVVHRDGDLVVLERDGARVQLVQNARPGGPASEPTRHQQHEARIVTLSTPQVDPAPAARSETNAWSLRRAKSTSKPASVIIAR
jgi:hypothetical protein